MAKIATKDDFLARSKAGLLGNHPNYWGSVWEARLSGWEGKVALRYAERDSPYNCYDLDLHEVFGKVLEFANAGADPGKFYLNEMEFGRERILQGEVRRLEEGLYLDYSTDGSVNVKRAITPTGRQAHNSAARIILRTFMCPNSYDDLEAIWDLYPDAAVEFTCFDGSVGALPDRNTIFWEVRDY